MGQAIIRAITLVSDLVELLSSYVFSSQCQKRTFGPGTLDQVRKAYMYLTNGISYLEIAVVATRQASCR